VYQQPERQPDHAASDKHGDFPFALSGPSLRIRFHV
jgi:hypothetical protein